jgi:hypothetical protein
MSFSRASTVPIWFLLQQSAEEYESIDIALARLVKENKISLATGLKYCENVVYFKQCAGTGK